jgi:ketosteroid isomerase-like protein
MSQENVELVRRMVREFNEQGIEAIAPEFLAADVEFYEPPEQPGARVARGREETVEFFAGFDQAWTQHRSEPEEIRALDAERVLLLSVERFRGRDGIEVAQAAGTIFALRQGKVVRWHSFWNRDTALHAAGLSE